MKQTLLLLLLITTYASAAITNIDSFEADFIQTITDDKDKVIKYMGHVVAKKPKSAAWNYTKPLKKQIYINKYEAVIVEPEIEQVIIRRFHNEFDFFKMISKAKQVSKKTYVTIHNNVKYTISMDNGLISSVSYLDQFENKVKIEFLKQKQNKKIDKKVFIPKYPIDFDIIRE